MNILIINGPNLNLLGKRNPELYGRESFEEYLIGLRDEFKEIWIDYYQSNVEGELINKLQQADGLYHGVILNAGGYTHTSVAIGDAIEAIDVDVIEVHISNIFSREEYRHISYISPHAKGVISGLGLDGYRMAILHFVDTNE
jgi:3-dehydroquinate dehydratase-2